MDEAWRKLIQEFKAKARAARAHAAKISYKNQSVKGNLNTEAAVYESCAQRLEEEYKLLQRGQDG